MACPSPRTAPMASGSRQAAADVSSQTAMALGQPPQHQPLGQPSWTQPSGCSPVTLMAPGFRPNLKAPGFELTLVSWWPSWPQTPGQLPQIQAPRLTQDKASLCGPRCQSHPSGPQHVIDTCGPRIQAYHYRLRHQAGPNELGHQPAPVDPRVTPAYLLTQGPYLPLQGL